MNRAILAVSLLAACTHRAAGDRPDGGPGIDDASPADPDGGSGGTDGGGGGSDGGGGGIDGGGGGTDGGGGGTDGGGGVVSATCDVHHWRPALPVAGTAMMAYQGTAYLFASDGLVWTVVTGGVGSTGTIPMPAGVTTMQAVVAEIGPADRPLVSFYSGGKQWAAWFDGAHFGAPIQLTAGSTIHADAAREIFEVGPMGLVEYAPGAAPLYRGALPFTPVAWTVGADGAVHLLRHATQPSIIHPGSTADVLLMRTLPDGSLTWSADVLVASNEGWGFSPVLFAAAPDGSLHVAYEPIGIYLRSHDGASWDEDQFLDYSSTATMIDPSVNPEAAKPGGLLRVLAAQDYDHAELMMNYHTGSAGTPSSYILRSCPPFGGPNQTTWPVERFAFSGLAGDYGVAAFDERGLTNLMSPSGLRQEAPGL